jgi:DUF177 domain-containing protein
MKILVDDIKASPKRLCYREDVDELNARLGNGAHEYSMGTGMGVDVEYYRAGLDLFFRGSLDAQVQATCARCLEEYEFPLHHDFDFVLVPRAAAIAAAPHLSADDLALSHYEGEEIDLTPLVHEQTILALPTRPLCREGCQGLCDQCGANLNTAPCACPPRTTEPRFAVLHHLTRGK